MSTVQPSAETFLLGNVVEPSRVPIPQCVHRSQISWHHGVAVGRVEESGSPVMEANRTMLFCGSSLLAALDSHRTLTALLL
jgi:hypothetical protein